MLELLKLPIVLSALSYLFLWVKLKCFAIVDHCMITKYNNRISLLTFTLREVCQQEFDRFQERFKSTKKAKDYQLSALLSFWAGEGRALYPNMARVARVLLSVPASAAERDFSTAGSRSRLADEYVEMTLFLNGNKECIPVEVPSLSESQIKEAMPRRLTNPGAEVAALSTGVEDVVPVVVGDANINDEYAAEAISV